MNDDDLKFLDDAVLALDYDPLTDTEPPHYVVLSDCGLPKVCDSLGEAKALAEHMKQSIKIRPISAEAWRML